MRLPPDQIELIKKLPLPEQREILRLARLLDRAENIEGARSNYLDFAKYCWDVTEGDPFIDTAHWRKIASIFDAMLRGDLNRVIINIAPRVGKSRASSLFLPAYFLGKNPKHSIIQATHTAQFSVEWGEKVRDLVASDKFRDVFPDVALKADNKAKGHWKTNHGGEYFAVGAGGRMVGRNADLLIIDDPHSEQDGKMAAYKPEVFDRVYEWYLAGPRQRLTPRSKLLLIQCVAAGQRVLMADGSWRKIEEVAPGDVVYAYDESSPSPVKRKVLASIPQGEDDCLEIKTTSASLRVNRRHPLLVGRKPEGKPWGNEWSLEWIQAGDLRAGDYVVQLKSKAEDDGVELLRESGQPWQDEFYWLFGFILGDGWIVRDRSRGDVGVAIARSVYKDRNERYNLAFEECFGRKLKPTKFGYDRADFAAAAQYLRSIGLESGAKNKRIPDWVFTLPPAKQRLVLNGLFAADGHEIGRRHRLGLRFSGSPPTQRFVSASFQLIEDARRLARLCGFRVSNTFYHGAERHPPHTKGKRHFESWGADFRDLSGHIEQNLRFKGQGAFGEHFRFNRVAEIAAAPRAEVYDLTIEGSENFIAEGFVVHNTRWGMRDLTGRIIERAKEVGQLDQWHVVEFPAIFPDGKWLAAERFPLQYWIDARDEYPASYWNSVYQQQPTSEEGALVKREWWRPWEGAAPDCEFIIQSWDTAYLKTERSDFNACTTWGVFKTVNPDGRPVPAVILLDSFKARMEFPELKNKARTMYKDAKPDCLLIEAKAAGAPLASELRSMGIPVSEFTPSRGNDKIARVNAISDVFKSGWVYFMPKKENEFVIEEFAAFPSGTNDDFVDSGTQAILRFRQGGFIKTAMDYDYDEDDDTNIRRRPKYY